MVLASGGLCVVRLPARRHPRTASAWPPACPAPFPAEEVIKDWKKAAKGDAAVRLASMMNEEGKQGVVAAFEQVGPPGRVRCTDRAWCDVHAGC